MGSGKSTAKPPPPTESDEERAKRQKETEADVLAQLEQEGIEANKGAAGVAFYVTVDGENDAPKKVKPPPKLRDKMNKTDDKKSENKPENKSNAKPNKNSEPKPEKKSETNKEKKPPAKPRSGTNTKQRGRKS
jgi:hypothetical protein